MLAPTRARGFRKQARDPSAPCVAAKKTRVKKSAVKTLTLGSSCGNESRGVSVSARLTQSESESEGRRTHDLHHLLDVVAEPPEEQADDGLDGDDPALAAAEFGAEARVDDGGPQELERVRVGAEGEDADLRVREL